jgi:hypothetical protein
MTSTTPTSVGFSIVPSLCSNAARAEGACKRRVQFKLRGPAVLVFDYQNASPPTLTTVNFELQGRYGACRSAELAPPDSRCAANFPRLSLRRKLAPRALADFLRVAIRHISTRRGAPPAITANRTGERQLQSSRLPLRVFPIGEAANICAY